MSHLDPDVSRAITAQAVLSSALSLAHSFWRRGPSGTLLFAGLGIALPLASEYSAINQSRLLRHHTTPQWQGIPLMALLGWYNIVYATFAIWETLLAGAPEPMRRRLLPIATAITTTNLDLLTDCYGLDEGLWEWTEGGNYATEIAGPNGVYGIPLVNFAGWVGLTYGVTSLYLRAGGEKRGASSSESNEFAGRTAALLLLVYYLPALVWAIRQGRLQYVTYSLLVPVVLLATLWGRGRRCFTP